MVFSDYLRNIGAWEEHRIKTNQDGSIVRKEAHKFHNESGDWIVTTSTKKINVGGILIEYEGEDSGIGILFASKAAVQVCLTIRIIVWSILTAEAF